MEATEQSLDSLGTPIPIYKIRFKESNYNKDVIILGVGYDVGDYVIDAGDELALSSDGRKLTLPEKGERKRNLELVDKLLKILKCSERNLIVALFDSSFTYVGEDLANIFVENTRNENFFPILLLPDRFSDLIDLHRFVSILLKLFDKSKGLLLLDRERMTSIHLLEAGKPLDAPSILSKILASYVLSLTEYRNAFEHLDKNSKIIVPALVNNVDETLFGSASNVFKLAPYCYMSNYGMEDVRHAQVFTGNTIWSEDELRDGMKSAFKDAFENGVSFSLFSDERFDKDFYIYLTVPKIPEQYGYLFKGYSKYSGIQGNSKAQRELRKIYAGKLE